MNDWQRLDELLERGLDFYGRQLVSEAIQCWREVLYLSPGHRLALEYLEAAGASADEEFDPEPRAAAKGKRAVGTQAPATIAASTSSTSSPSTAPPEETPLTLESLSVLAVELIRERRLEEALALLYTAHGEAPKDQAISRSINVIKQKLTREYRAEIGNDLGQIPHLTVDEALIEELELSDDEREVLRLVDGIVALDDVVQAAGFAPLQIYRALAQVLRRNLIVLKPPPPLEGPRTKTAPFRPTLVPPAPEQVTPLPSGPKLVSLPPVPESKEAREPKEKEARETTGQVVTLPTIPSPPASSGAPVSIAPASDRTEKVAEAKLEAKVDARAETKPETKPEMKTELPKVEPSRPPMSTALPRSAAPTGPITAATKMPIPPAPMPLTPSGPTTTISTSVTSVISANASQAVATAASAANTAAMQAASNKQLDSDASNALAAALGTIDAQPRRPSAYASHVAEAVRAHLQGKIARARELLVLCIQECPPDDPAAQRNLQRLKERLGVKEER